MYRVIKTTIFLGLCVAFSASFISVRAVDTSTQAAARAALEQTLKNLDNPQSQPPPATNAPSVAGVVPPSESTPNTIVKVSANTVTSQTATAATTPISSPPGVTPVAVVPAVATRPLAAPIQTQAAAVPAMPKPVPAPTATKSPRQPVKPRSTDEISTATGAIYKNVEVEKVDPDGIIVSYTPVGGGIAVAKIYFSDVSDAVRQRYQKK